MRKLSKKISMLMVLAMLVSLFSGVVSASAASVWSFYNKTADVVVERNGNYEMENDQFADFDLYKSDEIVDTDVYTVVYESSDEEVVWVNAKNGKLRAQKDAEIGATAKITAHITNKVTGAEADRSFTIEIVEAEVEEVEYVITPNFGEEAFVVGEEYELAAVITADGEEVEADIVFTIDDEEVEVYAPAKAGEVIIVATAVIDGEEYAAEFVCEVIEAVASEIVSAKQKDAKTVELTFDAKITEAEAAKIELYLGTVVKNNYKKAVKVKDNVVTFESYATFGNGKTWTFVYGDSKIDLKSSQGEVAKVVITGPEFFYLKSNGVNNAPAEIKFDCYDALGVKVSMPSSAYIEWKVDNTAASLSGNYISFTEKDKVAALSGIYHTGKFDEANGWNEVTFDIEEYIVTSVDNNDATMVGIGSKGVATTEKYDSMTVPANSTGYKLWIKFLYDDANKTQKKAADLGVDDKGNQIVTYESTDSSKLIVDQRTGELIPLKQGNVDVVINVKGEFYAAVTVTVGPAVASTAPTFKASTAQLSNSKELAQTVVYTVEGKDNYGANCAYTVSAVNVKSDPYNPNTEKAAKDALKANFVTIAGNTVTVAVVGADGSVLKTGNYVFEIKAKGFDNKEYVQNVSVYVRDAADKKIASVAIEFVGGKNAYDTAANKDTANFDGKVAFNIVAKNSAGVAIKNIAAVTGGLEIKLGSDVIAKDVKELALYNTKDDGVYTVSGGANYAAIKNGTYVITGKVLVDGTSYNLPNTSFTVSNSQAAPAIATKNAAITLAKGNIGTLDAELVKCFEAPKNADNGDYTFSAISLGTVKKTVSDTNCEKGEYSVFVESLKITQNFKAGAMVTYTVTVNQNITLTVTE